MARSRRRSSGQVFRWKFLHRRLLSFPNFILFVAALLLLGLAPSILLHLRLKRGLVQKCQWLYSRPLICAHGGDTSRAPPNTIEAYNLALRSQADCIEIDTTRTRDGVLVALHNRDLQNIYSNDYLQVGDLTFDEIRRLDAGNRYPKEFQNQVVPTLAAALQHVWSSLSQVVIDAKIGPPMFGTSLAADILAVVNSTHCRNCLVWSKADTLVRELKLLSPDVPMGYIVMRDEVTGRVTDPMRIVEGEVVGAYHGVVDSTTVANVHRAGKKLYAWTVNEREIMEKMLYEGVDGIVTSHPALLHEVMLELENQCFEEGFSL